MSEHTLPIHAPRIEKAPPRWPAPNGEILSVLARHLTRVLHILETFVVAGGGLS